MRWSPLLVALVSCGAEPDPCTPMCAAATALYGGCLESWGVEWTSAGYDDEADFTESCETWAWSSRLLEEDAGKSGEIVPYAASGAYSSRKASAATAAPTGAPCLGSPSIRIQVRHDHCSSSMRPQRRLAARPWIPDADDCCVYSVPGDVGHGWPPACVACLPMTVCASLPTKPRTCRTTGRDPRRAGDGPSADRSGMPADCHRTST